MKRFLLCFAFVGVGTLGAVAQQVLIMPDSTNNRLVSFDPFNGSLINSNMFALAAGTQIHAMQVGNEIWVSEQIGDRVSRWDPTGTALGQIGGGTSGGLDNIRGMGLINGTVYVTNAGTANGAPGANAVVMYNTSGANLGFFNTTALAPSPFAILAHQGGLLVSSSSGANDVHKFTLAGASVSPFHNSTTLNFAEQMDYALDGNVLVAGFSSNNVVKLDVNTGALISSFAASGARGVHQLGNGNIMWTSGAGVSIFDVNTGGSSLIYAGGGRYIDFFTPVPEPASILALAGAALAFARRRRK